MQATSLNVPCLPPNNQAISLEIERLLTEWLCFWSVTVNIVPGQSAPEAASTVAAAEDPPEDDVVPVESRPVDTGSADLQDLAAEEGGGGRGSRKRCSRRRPGCRLISRSKVQIRVMSNGELR